MNMKQSVSLIVSSVSLMVIIGSISAVALSGGSKPVEPYATKACSSQTKFGPTYRQVGIDKDGDVVSVKIVETGFKDRTLPLSNFTLKGNTLTEVNPKLHNMTTTYECHDGKVSVPDLTAELIMSTGIKSEHAGYKYLPSEKGNVYAGPDGIVTFKYADQAKLSEWLQNKVQQQHVGYPVSFSWGYDYVQHGSGDPTKSAGTSTLDWDYTVTNAFNAKINYHAHAEAEGSTVVSFKTNLR